MPATDLIPNNKAAFYDGKKIPLDQLSPSDFESFVYGSLICISDTLGVQITGKPSGSGDGGFDLQGIVLNTKKILCIQCKRQKTALSTSQISTELAKVAATSALEGSILGIHHFICTGGISRNLRSQLRENKLEQLAKSTGAQLATEKNNSELSRLREQLIKKGLNPEKIAEDYVRNLDALLVWSTDEFDAALSPRWDEVLLVIERFFKVATLIKEHPRATFIRGNYIADHSKFTAPITPRVSDVVLPDWISGSSAANPIVSDLDSRRSVREFNDLAEIKTGELAIILGDGGAGKSTALKLLRSEIIRLNPEFNIPVLISLSHYTPGSLDKLIHSELDINYGYWKTLPDKVYLLCDGLNECPSQYVANFISELEPLLKQKSVACVLSTRSSARHKKVVLSCEVSYCVQIDSLTPIGIKKLAEYFFKDSNDEFIKKYRVLADNSQMLWTPFSVSVALSLWQSHHTIPSTLSEMLQKLLEARCARNSESAVRNLGKEVVLKVAGTLAFQLIVIHGKLECSQLESGSLIQTTKDHCSDALGIKDISELELVQTLIDYELLYVSNDENLNFGHQLVAGALAGKNLSKEWRNHLNCLEDSIADDVWVFAAQHINPTEVREFLESIFKVDLILGARVTRELPTLYHTIAEELLEETLVNEVPETVQIRGLHALARLGTQNAQTRIQKEIYSGNERLYAAERALATSGRLDFLRQLLLKVEDQRNFPGTVSGGPLAIWERAPLPIRVDLARQYLMDFNPKKPIKESLRYLAYERDEKDALIIKKYLAATERPDTYQAALFALAEVSFSSAKKHVLEILDDADLNISSKLEIMRFATQLNIEIDAAYAFDCSLNIEVIPDEDIHHTNYRYHRFIEEVVNQHPIPKSRITYVEENLAKSEGELKARLWIIATNCRSTIISSYSSKCIEDWGAELGSACNYFINQYEERKIHQNKLINHLETGLRNHRKWDSWHVWRALSLSTHFPASQVIGISLTNTIRSLVKVRKAIKLNDINDLSVDEKALLGQGKVELAHYHIDLTIAHLAKAIANTKDFIPESDLLSLIQFDWRGHSASEGYLSKILINIDNHLIDQSLESIEDHWSRLSCLKEICQLGVTKTRLQLLSQSLVEYYHPAAMSTLCEAVEICWNQQVCEMVMQTVASIPNWSEYDAQFFNHFFEMIVRNVNSNDQITIDSALESAKTNYARKSLEFWKQVSIGGRVGLSKLETF